MKSLTSTLILREAVNPMADTLLEVKNLKKYFKSPTGVVHAVDDVSFTINRGETLGIVGESGCGKTTIGKTVIRLLEPTSGEVLFEGQNIYDMNKAQMHKLRKKVQIIFQDPFSSLNPRRTVFDTIAEPLRYHKIIPNATKGDIEARVLEMMKTVGLAERLINAYPHELDGGRRQRIGIARALAVEPKFIVCDEPVSALDVSIQAQILNLLKELQEERNLTFVFVTHNLAVVNYFSDNIVVMYLGMVVEKAPSAELFDHPLHPYTRALLSAILVPEVGANQKRVPLRGELSSPIDPPNECRFAKRCGYYCEACDNGIPPLIEVSRDHFVACHRVASPDSKLD